MEIDRKEVGTRIRRERLIAGMTRQDLADLIGMSASSISNAQSGGSLYKMS